jgi:hypothetical protein
MAWGCYPDEVWATMAGRPNANDCWPTTSARASASVLRSAVATVTMPARRRATHANDSRGRTGTRAHRSYGRRATTTGTRGRSRCSIVNSCQMGSGTRARARARAGITMSVTTRAMADFARANSVDDSRRPGARAPVPAMGAFNFNDPSGRTGV